ncbi:MAG: GyrI-like domain-containing protein [Clostridia bacterium]|jgi:hypothetical protein
MKFEWRKDAKKFYLPKAQPEMITVPPQKFFILCGQGNPNSDRFAEEVGVLYALSYAIKMMPKNNITPEGYFEYTVFPLEGIWDLAEEARGLDSLDKDKLVYTIMIRQPDFVTDDLAQLAIEKAKQKNPHPLYDKVRFGSIEDGLCVQMMHVGPYDSEPESFAKMEAFCRENNLKRKSLTHREIYITDPRRTPPEKRKTELRFKVEKV